MCRVASVVAPEQLVRRFLARAPGKHYRFDKRRLKGLNDPASNEDQMRTLGGYSKWHIEIVPIKDIRVPKVWRPDRFEKAKALMEKGVALDPIDASKEGGKWEISDGIHRTNASLALGYTHVPVLVSEWIETPDKLVPEPPEKARLALGDWVEMNKPYDGRSYGWVDEVLGPRTYRGVKRYWYNIALVRKGDDWPHQADFSDTEFEPARAPSWGPAIQKEVGVGQA